MAFRLLLLCVDGSLPGRLRDLLSDQNRRLGTQTYRVLLELNVLLRNHNYL